MTLEYDLDKLREVYAKFKRVYDSLNENDTFLNSSSCPEGFKEAVFYKKTINIILKSKESIFKITKELSEIIENLEIAEGKNRNISYEFALYGSKEMSNEKITRLINGEEGELGNNIWNNENASQNYDEMTYNTALIISMWCKKQGYNISLNPSFKEGDSIANKYIINDTLGNPKSVADLIEEVRIVCSNNSNLNANVKNNLTELLYKEMNYADRAEDANLSLVAKIGIVNTASGDYFQSLYEQTGIDKREYAKVDTTKAVIFPSYEEFVYSATNGQGVPNGVKINGYYNANTGYIYLPPDVNTGTIYHEWVGHATGSVMLNNASVQTNGYNYIGLNEGATQAMAIKAGVADHETAYDSVSYCLMNIEKAIENSGNGVRVLDVAYYGEDKRYMQKIVDEIAIQNEVIPKGSYYVLLAKTSYKIINDPYLTEAQRNAQIDYLERYTDSFCRSIDSTYDTWKYSVPRM